MSPAFEGSLLHRPEYEGLTPEEAAERQAQKEQRLRELRALAEQELRRRDDVPMTIFWRGSSGNHERRDGE